MPDKKTVRIEDGSKLKFQKKCKFSLCFESNVHEGFVTEKITDAFYAETIPIYYGDPYVTEIFNSKAFINVMDYPDWNSVIERIKYIDSHDDEFLKMLNQPVFNDNEFITKTENGLSDFILHIFEQPKNKAYRRSRSFWSKTYNDYYRRIGMISRMLRESFIGKAIVSLWIKIHK